MPIVAALTLAAAALAPGAERMGEAEACPLRGRFGSFASGIDRAAYEGVSAALRDDPRAASVTVRPWGREGERDLCVTPRTPTDAAPLARVAEAAVPARKLNGYVEIEVERRRVFSTQGR